MINGGDNWRRLCKKWQEHSFFGDNAGDAIAENQYDQLDESDSIKDRKCPEKMNPKYSQLLWNSFHVT